MTDFAVHTLDQAETDPEREPVRLDVQEVVRGFSKALRTHLLYEGSGPALERFVDTLRGKMASLWDRSDEVTIRVDEHDLLWEGASVYHAEERGEDLAFLLYKDGVRELSFHPGFEAEELGAFLELLARIHRLRQDEEDLLTLLWEHDWLYFRYKYVDPLNEGVQVPVSSGAPPPKAPPPAEEPDLVSSVSREDFQETLYFLDEGEMRRLTAELKLEMERDLWTQLLNALFDRLQDGAAQRQAQLVSILSDILPTLLGAGKLESASYVLGELVGVATGGTVLAPPVIRGLRALFDQLARPETVAELVRVVEEAGDSVSEEALGRLFGFFPPEALGPLLHAGEAAASPAVRRSVLGAAERLGAAHQEHLVRLLADADASTVSGAARLVGRLRVVTAAPEVARLLQRPEAGLRLVAVEALQELRSPSASGALEGALDDADREVRVAAARALASLRYAPARAKLEAAIESKRLREADLTERIAFFEAYGGLAGADGVAILDRVLNGKSWLGRRETGEMRACAALGLGRIQVPAAEKALQAAAADPDPVVRSAVGRALRAVKT
ncbi:MAG TPA: HEAT repeat domain-containing protein [Longimicrobiaceae bacterium]|jgi:HEAT repeat protein|nr:HEAT repeat domain-containing protein [Longimicrobiaceae bacterium]